MWVGMHALSAIQASKIICRTHQAKLDGDFRLGEESKISSRNNIVALKLRAEVTLRSR